MSPADIAAFADVVHAPNNIGAPISSGSFRVHGMIIAPCSIRTASSMATGITDELTSRAADVMLKERRPSSSRSARRRSSGHVETLTKLAALGAIVFPPVPSFYHRPKSIDAIVDQICMRILDQVDIASIPPPLGRSRGIPAVGDG